RDPEAACLGGEAEAAARQALRAGAVRDAATARPRYGLRAQQPRACASCDRRAVRAMRMRHRIRARAAPARTPRVDPRDCDSGRSAAARDRARRWRAPARTARAEA